jgi:hypothetical protein
MYATHLQMTEQQRLLPRAKMAHNLLEVRKITDRNYYEHRDEITRDLRHLFSVIGLF